MEDYSEELACVPEPVDQARFNFQFMRSPKDAVQHSTEGIEIKGSRHASGWQGHNAEAVWLMVFYFDSNTANDVRRDIGPKPFRFLGVYAAQLDLADWNFSGRSATSRRTITASVNQNGVAKMRSNWVYRASR